MAVLSNLSRHFRLSRGVALELEMQLRSDVDLETGVEEVHAQAGGVDGF